MQVLMISGIHKLIKSIMKSPEQMNKTIVARPNVPIFNLCSLLLKYPIYFHC